MKYSRVPLLLSLIVSVGACATILKQNPQMVPVTSDPAGAEVLVNGTRKGVTPMRLSLATDTQHVITVKSTHYPAGTRTLSSSVSVGYAIADILFGVVPLVVDVLTGNIYNLSADKLHFQFAPVIAPPPVAAPIASEPRNPPRPFLRSRPSRHAQPAKPAPKRTMSCCVNGSYYSCPSAAAVAQCAPPQLPSCLMSCGMMDSACPEQCIADYPPNPSACSREASQDSSCKR